MAISGLTGCGQLELPAVSWRHPRDSFPILYPQALPHSPSFYFSKMSNFFLPESLCICYSVWNVPSLSFITCHLLSKAVHSHSVHSSTSSTSGTLFYSTCSVFPAIITAQNHLFYLLVSCVLILPLSPMSTLLSTPGDKGAIQLAVSPHL